MRTDGTPKLIGFRHVWPLAGADALPAGTSGVLAEVNVLALWELLAWLCATLGQPIPPPLETVRQPGAVVSPGGFAEAFSRHLQAW